MKRYFKVELAMITREVADVIVVLDESQFPGSNEDMDLAFAEIMSRAYDATDGTEYKPDVDWGVDEGTHAFCGEVTEEAALEAARRKELPLIDLTKEVTP
jgi:hypothetical protein